MAVDDRFEIASEVSVECNHGALGFRKRDGFREEPARMKFRRAKHSHGPRAVFDDDFGAGAHVD